VREHADSGDDVSQRVCAQLLANRPRYSEWYSLHEGKMRKVADARLRNPQVLELRNVAVQNVHATALVNYLRLGRITGPARDHALRMFHGVCDLRDATLAEHRRYLLAASTRVCTHELLELVGDAEGLDAIRRYEMAYAQYFTMFCERGFALEAGRNYLLGSLLPEVKDVADRLRIKIVGAKLRPTAPRTTRALAPPNDPPRQARLDRAVAGPTAASGQAVAARRERQSQVSRR
jgi:hypothetical protein